MINNRQAGRRRGRGGQRSQGGGNPGRPDNGNRIDNRARGNAAQLLEKYKSLARDAQMQGDRVNTEYYLQFADHYFRVLNENRSRFEEQRRGREDQFDGDEDEDFEGDQQEERGNRYAPDRFAGDQRGRDEGDRRNGRDYQPREAVPAEAAPRANGHDAAEPVALPDPVEAAGEDEATRPRRGRGRRARGDVAADAEPVGIPAAIEPDRLPPALGAAEAQAAPDEGGEEAPKPRRRRRTAAEAPAS